MFLSSRFIKTKANTYSFILTSGTLSLAFRDTMHALIYANFVSQHISCVTRYICIAFSSIKWYKYLRRHNIYVYKRYVSEFSVLVFIGKSTRGPSQISTQKSRATMKLLYRPETILKDYSIIANGFQVLPTRSRFTHSLESLSLLLILLFRHVNRLLRN